MKFRPALKRFPISTGLTLVLTLLFYCLLSLPAGWIIEKLVGHPYGYLGNYYNYYNHAPKEGSQGNPDPDIVIIDAHDNSLGSRGAMAGVLDRLALMKPKAVGMDIIFSSTHESVKAEDDALEQAVRNYPGELVLACRSHGPDSLEHSFFTVNSGRKFGTVNAQSFYGFVPRDSVPPDAVPGGWAYKMVYVMAGKPDPENPIINYENTSFRTIHKLDDITPSTIDDKYVLIGDCQDNKDETDVPFKIEGRSSLPGVVINAYQLSTLIHQEKRLKPMSCWKSWIICAMLLLICGMAASAWSDAENNMFEKETLARSGRGKMIGNTILISIEPLIVLILEVCALLLLNGYIHSRHTIINVLPFMLGLLIYGTADKLVKLWLKKLSIKDEKNPS